MILNGNAVTIVPPRPVLRVAPMAGPPGQGVAAGGASLAVLRKLSVTDFDTEWHTLTAADVGAASTAALTSEAATARAAEVAAANAAAIAQSTANAAGSAAATAAAAVVTEASTRASADATLLAKFGDYQTVLAGIAGWAVAGAFALSGSQTYDATYSVLTGASITWPDGATGVFASTGIDTTSTNPGGLTGFTATHVLSGVTLTATVVIPRNGSGQVSGAMTVTVA